MGLREVTVKIADVVPLRRDQRSDPPLSDEALARACASGDPSAIAGLFDRFRVPVERYLHRLTGGGPDVEDLLQTTFLEVARGRSVYDDSRAKVVTWIFAIATNVVRHHRRSAARRTNLAMELAHTGTIMSNDVANVTDARRQLERAQRALMDLPGELREVFVLCDLEGLSAKDAGRVVGASEAAVWKRASKARRILREAVLGGAP